MENLSWIVTASLSGCIVGKSGLEWVAWQSKGRPVRFIYHYEHAIDSKQRLAIPADIRAKWRPERDGEGWVAVPWVGGIIRLYTEADFEKRADSGILTLTPDEDEAELQSSLLSECCRLEMDAAGRIRLPEDMIRYAGLSTEVVLLGCGDYLEIRDRANWKASRRDRLAKVPELVARISAKRERGMKRE